MNWRVPFCGILFALINLLMVSTGAARLAGVYTKRIATALTLFNTFILVSRMANLLMVPEIGKLADIARESHNLQTLEIGFRIILFSAAVGCVLATLLIPTFVEIFKRGISAFERTNSLPLVFLGLLNPRRSRRLRFILAGSALVGLLATMGMFHLGLARGPVPLILGGMGTALALYVILASLVYITHPEIFRPPSWMGVSLRSLAKLPKDFLLLNVFVQGFWTVGWMAAVYAGTVEHRLAFTAVSLSGIITGVSTILLTVFVDPKAALITDQAAHGIRSEEEIKAVVIYLTMGNIIGTLFAQVLFTPASWLIRVVALHL